MKTLTLEQLAQELGQSVWSKGNLKRIYLNDAGYNTKKMSTKAFIYEVEGEFKVSVSIECPSQPWQWIKSQQEEVRDSILNQINEILSDGEVEEVIEVTETNKNVLIEVNPNQRLIEIKNGLIKSLKDKIESKSYEISMPTFEVYYKKGEMINRENVTRKLGEVSINGVKLLFENEVEFSFYKKRGSGQKYKAYRPISIPNEVLEVLKAEIEKQNEIKRFQLEKSIESLKSEIEKL